MAETAVLMPVPFYPPVRTGAGALIQYGESHRRPNCRESPMRTVARDWDADLAYTSRGHLVADDWIGTRVNIYV